MVLRTLATGYGGAGGGTIMLKPEGVAPIK
jgi:hypothetical protein